MGCGQPLATGANFCVGCGRAVPSPAPAAPGGSPPTPPGGATANAPAPSFGSPATPAAVSPASGGAALAAALHLAGVRNFLLQHQLVSAGRNYRVLDREKHHLFTVKEDLRQELRANFLSGMGQGPGFRMGPIALGTRTSSWTILDSAENPRGVITIQVAGYNAVSTLADAAGTPLLAITVARGMVGGLTATAALPGGPAILQARGNLLRHNFSIQDPAGQEVAKIHEAWASVRDSYNLDLVGNADPLAILIFAIMIDREKATE
jgi:hypothetical protein